MNRKSSSDMNTNTNDFSFIIVLAAGVATLFLELTFIRYSPGQVRVLGYFSNFVLTADFPLLKKMKSAII
jgi:hypothetical protein